MIFLYIYFVILVLGFVGMLFLCELDALSKNDLTTASGEIIIWPVILIIFIFKAVWKALRYNLGLQKKDNYVE